MNSPDPNGIVNKHFISLFLTTLPSAEFHFRVCWSYPALYCWHWLSFPMYQSIHSKRYPWWQHTQCTFQNSSLNFCCFLFLHTFAARLWQSLISISKMASPNDFPSRTSLGKKPSQRCWSFSQSYMHAVYSPVFCFPLHSFVDFFSFFFFFLIPFHSVHPRLFFTLLIVECLQWSTWGRCAMIVWCVLSNSRL